MLIGMKESGIQATSPAELRDNVVNFLKTADRDTVAHNQGFLTNQTHVDHTNHTGNDAEMQEDVDYSIAMISDAAVPHCSVVEQIYHSLGTRCMG